MDKIKGKSPAFKMGFYQGLAVKDDSIGEEAERRYKEYVKKYGEDYGS